MDFQITTSKMILILNHLYLGDLILKSSTYDDFAHLCSLHMAIIHSLHFFLLSASWTHSSNISGWVLNKFNIKPLSQFESSFVSINLLTLHVMTVIFLSEVLKLVYMSHTITRDAERTTGTPPPLIVCARLSPLRKVLFCSLSAPPMLPLVYGQTNMLWISKVPQWQLHLAYGCRS